MDTSLLHQLVQDYVVHYTGCGGYHAPLRPNVSQIDESQVEMSSVGSKSEFQGNPLKGQIEMIEFQLPTFQAMNKIYAGGERNKNTINSMHINSLLLFCVQMWPF